MSKFYTIFNMTSKIIIKYIEASANFNNLEGL